MLRNTCIIALALLLLSSGGCIGSKRYVQDNTFHSTMLPKIKVKIDASYEFLGEEDENYIGNWKNQPQLGGPHIKEKLFKFQNEAGKNFIRIGIKQIASNNITLGTNGTISPYTSSYKKNVLSQGKVGLEDLYYFVYSYGYEKDDGSKACMLKKASGKNVGASEVQFEIAYYREITGLPDSSYSCEDWSDYQTLTNEQKKILDDFMKTSDKDISFPQ